MSGKELEEELRLLVDIWRSQAKDYPRGIQGQTAAAAVMLCADELEEVLKENRGTEG